MKKTINFQSGATSSAGSFADNNQNPLQQGNIAAISEKEKERLKTAYDSFLGDFGEKTTDALITTMKETGATPENLREVIGKGIPQPKLQTIGYYFRNLKETKN